jgi:hypothetical protein
LPAPSCVSVTDCVTDLRPVTAARGGRGETLLAEP